MNIIILTGRLTKHPECKRTDSGKSYAQFSIAVNRSYVGKSGQKETDFINCVAWGTTAENLAKYQEKGSLILVEGELQQNSYKNKNGENITAYQVVVARIEYLGSIKKKAETFESDPFGATATESKDDEAFKEITNEVGDNLPF